MRRREFIALAGASAAWPLAVMAQEAGRTYRIGVLFASPRGADVVTAFFEGVQRQGFIEGQNLTVVYHALGITRDLLAERVAELVKAHVDVITTTGELATRTAQNATKTIPILAITDDMLGSGLVNSMSRPGGNTTGVSILATELDGKRQELLIEAVPGLRHLAALADSSRSAAKLASLQEAARASNVALSVYQITKGDEIAAAIETAHASGATALNVLASPIFYFNRHIIMDRAAALRLPTMYHWPELAEERGFAAYGPRLFDLFRVLLPRQLAQILRGTKVADIPVEQPTKFELVINLNSAKAMGMTVPEALLARADKVIE